MAEVISFNDVVRARRRSREREHSLICVAIVEASLQHTLSLMASAPASERPVRARQVRQLAELLEYIVSAEC
jgi:hypothetical protein